jgi:hypothetical protein
MDITIDDLLDELDGNGLIIVDEKLLQCKLNQLGYGLTTIIDLGETQHLEGTGEAVEESGGLLL